MILGDHNVERPGTHENGIARPGPLTSTLFPRRGDGGHDDIKIFAAEQAILPARADSGQPPQCAVSLCPAPDRPFAPDETRAARFPRSPRRWRPAAKREWKGYHPQLVVGQHHGEVTGARARRRGSRCAPDNRSRRAHRFLVQRCGDDTGDAPRQRQIDGGNHPGIRRRARALIEPAEGKSPAAQRRRNRRRSPRRLRPIPPARRAARG